MSWSAVIGAAGAIGGALISKNGSKSSGNATTTTDMTTKSSMDSTANMASSGNTAATSQNRIDPRIEAMLFGQNGQGGMLDQYSGLLGQSQNSGLQNFGNNSMGYLDAYGLGNLYQSQMAAGKLMNGNAAPTAQATGVAPPAWATGSQVAAPGQNGMDLTGAYDSLINGAPGNNPYLTGAIQKGINQSSNAFGNMVTDTKNATQDVLGNIRSNSVLAGQYGGSRQGIAEGKAIDSMNTNLARAASQFGQNNTDAAVAAQAGAYDTDRNRQLAATQGLGAQQYATAFKNNDTKNAAEFMNVGTHNAINENYANRAQQTNFANQQAQLATNGMNNSALLGASGLLSGLNSSAYSAGQNMDSYGINRASQVNGLLTPYLGVNQTNQSNQSSTANQLNTANQWNTTNQTGTSSQPLYQNNGGNMLGGAMMGSQLLGGLFGGSGGGSNAGSIFDLFGKNSSFSGGGYF